LEGQAGSGHRRLSPFGIDRDAAEQDQTRLEGSCNVKEEVNANRHY